MKSWFMDQFVTVFSNDFQICSLISKSGVDGCGLQNAAARVITGTRKFDRGLGQILHDQLHRLDVPDRLSSS